MIYMVFWIGKKLKLVRLMEEKAAKKIHSLRVFFCFKRVLKLVLNSKNHGSWKNGPFGE